MRNYYSILGWGWGNMTHFLNSVPSYVSELTEHIKVKTSARQSSNRYDEMPDDFAFFFPTFIWTVRDFTLQLTLDGCPISEDEYLEHALKLKKGAVGSFPCLKRLGLAAFEAEA